jgi:hypothetical protein
MVHDDGAGDTTPATEPPVRASALRSNEEPDMTRDLISRWKHSNLIAAAAILLLTLAACGA